MTREEATDIMKAIIYMLEPMYDTDRVEDAVNMAIEALKQETVSRESYEHEYFLRKEFEVKIAKVESILDDCDLEAWEILEKIKEVVRA